MQHVLEMLNEYWAAVVPVIDRAGGSVEHFAGDGILVMFNTVSDQADHPARAARCALDILRVTDSVAAARHGWPRFRIGLNTGSAVVGNVGAEGRRSFAAIGDTTNLASRLLGAAQPGQVVIGAGTRHNLQPLIDAGTLRVMPLGPMTVKGKREPLDVWALSEPGQGD